MRLWMFGYSDIVWFLQTSYLAKDLLHFWFIIVLAVILYFFILFFSKCVHAMSAIRCCERISAAALVTQMAFRPSVLTTTITCKGFQVTYVTFNVLNWQVKRNSLKSRSNIKYMIWTIDLSICRDILMLLPLQIPFQFEHYRRLNALNGEIVCPVVTSE